MTQHVFKGRGELTLGETVLEVATEITLRMDIERSVIAYWPDLSATGHAPPGVLDVAQRVTDVSLDIMLHDYAYDVLAIAIGGSITAVTGAQRINLAQGDTTTDYALSFSGHNKMSSATGEYWTISIPAFRPDVIESLPIVGDKISGYRLVGHSLRDVTATGREYGYFSIAAGRQPSMPLLSEVDYELLTEAGVEIWTE